MRPQTERTHPAKRRKKDAPSQGSTRNCNGANQPITAALVALSMSGTSVRTYDVMSAAVLIGALPPLLVYFFGGKYFVRGLTQGAIK